MLNRFLFDGELEIGSVVTLTGDEMHHAARVHRTKVGEEVELFDGRGVTVTARVRAIAPKSIDLEILEPVVARESPLAVELAIALIQPDRFELVLQKGTELGVRSFLPLVTGRSEVRPERVSGKEGRWQKLLVEAAKQSGRSVIPVLEEAVGFAEALVRPGVNVVFDPSGMPGLPPGETLRLFIGPEGGWSEEELEKARAGGAHLCSLGPRRLRAETAAIAAAALALVGR